MNRKQHWEEVYLTKTPSQVSWTQAEPKLSLQFIAECKIDTNAQIIDIGGGDSLLVDYLLELGYVNITVLDISEKSILRAKERLGEKANKVNWIVSDILDFKPTLKYDVWHDRAAFHFLTNEEAIQSYKKLVQHYVSQHLIIATFSENGPLKCSGLDIKQYSASNFEVLFENDFKLVKVQHEDHITPFETVQNFIFCRFERKID